MPQPEKKTIGRQQMKSRIEQARETGLEPDLPPSSTPWLVEWLFEIGPSVPAGMGAGPIGWRDIAAWQELSGIDLMPWEAKILRKLSMEYVAEARRAEKPDCPAPWLAVPDAERREAVSRKVAGILGGMSAQNSKGQVHG